VQTIRRESYDALEVRDTGIGIPAAALPHIFDRFFRVDQARSREAGGAGLGLSIVRSICVAHRAEIEVDSEVGRGTCFRVKFPRYERPPITAARLASTPSGAGGSQHSERLSVSSADTGP
jgi:signal transduction histidine kinase